MDGWVVGVIGNIGYRGDRGDIGYIRYFRIISRILLTRADNSFIVLDYWYRRTIQGQ